jgi:peptidoglycan hydrolase-like protein with peptidoglycan-binding domain
VADQKVLDAQKWVNTTYGNVAGYQRCPEDGHTGWAVMYSLTMGLQHELGIPEVSENFGPTTLAKVAAKGQVGFGYDNANIIRIVQHALYCKGYWAGDATLGTYQNDTYDAVAKLKRDCGLFDNGYVQPKWFKALLTMDAYVLLSGGSEEVRSIQQWLISTYLNKSTFFVIPCDGHYTRDVQMALMKAIQYEIGIPEDQATGNFGPATQSGLRNHPVGPGSPVRWVQLFSAACVFNGAVRDTTTVFKSTWDDKLSAYVREFQKFSLIDENGTGDYRTWAQLLVSTGDPDRPAHGCDTRFQITAARARALHDAGYLAVGRYLDDPPGSTLNKKLQPSELQDIFSGGLRVLPIWQYNSRELGDFTWSQGYNHGLKAHARAVGYGFNTGTVLYFAVDYDATGEQITSNIVPYFNGVQAGLANQGKRYIAGVYGSRNVCARVSDEAYARFSFVSGMSYGFSGNLGFPMPANWSFNQIKEFKFSSGGDTFDLDNDVFSGADRAVGPENVGSTSTPVDDYLNYLDGLYATAVAYGGAANANLRVMEYLRYPRYVDLYTGWQILIGDVDREWIKYAQAHAPARGNTYKDPSQGVEIDADHFGATANSVFLKGSGDGTKANRGDFGGWGGDLATFYGEWRANSDAYASGYAFCMDRLAKLNVTSSFPIDDMVEDVDGYLIGTAVRNGAKINEAVRAHLSGGGHTTRFRRFYVERYGASTDNVVATARNMLISDGTDSELGALVMAAVRSTGGWNCVTPNLMPDDKLNPFLRGYADVVAKLANS